MPKLESFRAVMGTREFQMAVAAIITVAVCIVIAYLVVRQQIDANTAASAKQAVVTCHALLGLDNAKNGIVFSAPTKTGSAEKYILRLVANLHNVFISTGCQKLLGK